jgi:flagellar hook-associated protein 2
METEEIVKGLLTSEQGKIDSMKQSKQTLEWQQEAYGDILGDINGFLDTYYDVLKPETNISSTSNLKEVALYSGISNISRYAEVIVNGNSPNGDYVINEIKQTATATNIQSSSGVKGDVDGSVNLTEGMNFDNAKFKITLDGVSKEITVNGEFADGDELADYLNSAFDESFGSGRIIAFIDGEGKLGFASENSVIQVNKSSEGENFLEKVGIAEGERNVTNIYNSLNTEYGSSGNISFKINGESFTFGSSTTMADIMKSINSSDAGVKMIYNSLTDTFSMESSDTGAGSKIEIENIAGSLFGENSYIKMDEGTYNNGKDAIAVINGVTVTRSSNVFTIDNVTYSLKKETSEVIEFTVGVSSTNIADKITSFINDFNKLYTSIQERISEKVELDYKPLTDAQREEMTESQIEKWEEKAKSGVLRNDSILSSILNNLRNAFWFPTEGIGAKFSDIGITTSTNYNKFELVIDQSKLKEAIEKNSEEVLSLFNKEESISYSRSMTSASRTQRYNETGFAQRIKDILNDAASTRRDLHGNKGTLVEKIGVSGDATEFKNLMKTQIDSLEKRIQAAINRMTKKEDQYFKKFTQMEKVIQQLNAQSESLYGMTMF